MSEQLFKDGFINLDEYEIIPEVTPKDETPRQFLLRMTGKDFSELTVGCGLSDGDRDLTWQEVKDAGGLPIINRIMQLAYRPSIRLKKKSVG